MSYNRAFEKIGIVNLVLLLFPYVVWVFMPLCDNPLLLILEDGGSIFAIAVALIAIYTMLMTLFRSNKALPFYVRSPLSTLFCLSYAVYALCWVYYLMGRTSGILIFMIAALPVVAMILLSIDRKNYPCLAISIILAFFPMLSRVI